MVRIKTHRNPAGSLDSTHTRTSYPTIVLDWWQFVRGDSGLYAGSTIALRLLKDREPAVEVGTWSEPELVWKPYTLPTTGTEAYKRELLSGVMYVDEGSVTSGDRSSRVHRSYTIPIWSSDPLKKGSP